MMTKSAQEQCTIQIQDWPISMTRELTKSQLPSSTKNLIQKVYVKSGAIQHTLQKLLCLDISKDTKQAMITLRGMAEHRFSKYIN